MTRRCPTCRETKELTAANFYGSPIRYRGGFRYRCILCMRARDAERRMLRAMTRNRLLAKTPEMLDRLERSERRAELAEIGGLRAVHEIKARLAAARAVKATSCGRDIPAELLAAVLPP